MLRRHASQLEVVVEERTLNVVGFVPYRTCTFGWFQKETSFCENGVLPPHALLPTHTQTGHRTPPGERETRIYARVEEPAASTQPDAAEGRDRVSTRRLLSVPRPFASLVVASRENRSATARPMTRWHVVARTDSTPHDERLV